MTHLGTTGFDSAAARDAQAKAQAEAEAENEAYWTARNLDPFAMFKPGAIIRIQPDPIERIASALERIATALERGQE